MTETSEQGEGGRYGMNGGESGSTSSFGGGGSTGSDMPAMAREMAGQAREMAGGVANEVANRLPAAAAQTREVINQSSDDVLTAGTMLSLGVALGLLLGGSNRLLVAMALIPAAAMGATLVDRRNRGVGGM